MRLVIPDLISNSYFPAIAAVELGYMKDEGLDVNLNLMFPVTEAAHALRNGELDFLVGAAHAALYAFPDWKGVKLINAVSQNMYWFLTVRSDLNPRLGDLSILENLRVGAAPGPDLGLVKMLELAGMSPSEHGIKIGPVPGTSGAGISFGVTAAERLAEGKIDAFWANGMAAEVAVSRGVGVVIADPRRDGGIPATFTFPALMTTDKMIDESPDAVEGASRAIIRAQRELSADPDLATGVAKRLFPAMEAGLIAKLIARDAPFYDPTITEKSVGGINDFARMSGLLNGTTKYEDIVATRFSSLWKPDEL